ncbi:hypothetical protein E2562_034952 [Oryza meyeriana var. granulata]|uniref:R13L1/DRL21-like LRR repeat region domain-containing protein n=1 Tax=Oryza meyeriana var. granulata TaxID=110450 RepID=A0A6G1DAK9_9ORYZ|nr:hypothetical protein E2562_034952 [Oryza meyeriana var. granulata]
MGALHIHHVNKLCGEDGWDLLCSRAQLDKEKETMYMQAIGKKIVERCDGLPMVIKAVGGVLRCCEPTCNEWENVCNSIFSVLPDDVHTLIRLSYVDLPSPLKRCFLYCSLFPPDFVIRRRYVTQQWASEGFIEPVETVPQGIRKLTHLRTLLFFENRNLNSNCHGLAHTFRRLTLLRVLDLHSSNVEHVPNALGNVVHLRYLNLLRTRAAGAAGNQFNASGWPLTELSSLSKLTSLQILRLERATWVDALESTLSQKVNLRELELCCVNEQYNQEFTIRDVFEVLCPAPCLVVLKLQSYFGQEYPSWIAESKLPNLQCLELHRCSCKRLPALSELPHLRSLVLIDLQNLDIMGSELRGRLDANKAAFPRLEKLDFSGLDILLSWIDLEDGDLPSLRSVRFVGCWKLKSVPSVIWSRTKLGNINIDECPDLRWLPHGSDSRTSPQQQRQRVPILMRILGR